MPSLAEARANVAAETALSDESPRVDAPTEAKPTRAPKAAKEPTDCNCHVTTGCGAKSKGKFAPGHDARLVKHLTRAVVYEGLAQDEAVKVVDEASGNSVLLRNKLIGSVKRESENKNRKDRREAAKADAADSKAATEADAAAQAD